MTVNMKRDTGGKELFNAEKDIWIPDWYWYCGNGECWVYLPRLQRGRCALVQLNAHVLIIEETLDKPRKRRELANSLDAIPCDHRLVSECTRFAEILFPMFGVGNLRKHIELVHYHLAKFINATTDALIGVKQEITALRLMATQNRMVLDMLLAKEGGVCNVRRRMLLIIMLTYHQMMMNMVIFQRP